MEGSLKRAANALKGNPALPVLLSSLTALTALLAAFGGADAARRYHADRLTIAVAFVLTALLIAMIAALLDKKWIAAIAVPALVVGLLLASLAALDHQAGRPSITASLEAKPSPELDVSLKRDGLGSEDQMELFIEGRNYNATDGDSATDPPSVIYRASLGPDESGKVDLSFSIPLSPAPRYEAVLVKAWVTADIEDGEQNLDCARTQQLTKYAAACALAILPAQFR
jgi:hypothetical protein